MKWIAYKDLLPFASGLIVASASFGLGAVYSNLPYDYVTLWTSPATTEAYDKAFADSFSHYLKWANAPPTVHYILHFVFVVGLIGGLIKLYKPSEDAKYFEYGTLGLLVLAMVVYLTNLRTGINSAFHDKWGEVPRETGLNVIAASQFMIVVLLLGVLVLQGGLWFAEWYDSQLKIEFYEKNPDYTEVNGQPVLISDLEGAAAEAPEAIAEKPAATSTGAKTAATAAKKKKKKS